MRAIGSKVNLNDNSPISSSYAETVKDIINLREIASLDNYYQHLNTSRLQHSINVSYYSFRAAKFFKLDARKAARAVLMHDLYYYEFSGANMSCKEHSKVHSLMAVENAKKITELDEVEEDIILTHMWPMTNKSPAHLEGYVVTFADKMCAFFEVMGVLLKRMKLSFLFSDQGA